MQGHWDGGVTELGRQQIALLSDRLRDLRFDAVCSSDLYRAMLTASAVYRPRSLPLYTTPALRELNIGPWEQLFFGNLLYEEPELAQRFLTDPASWRLEGAETFAELTDRAYPALEAIARRYEGGRVAVVSHGVTIRCLLARITGIDLRDREKLPMLLNTAVSVLRWEKGAFSLELFNDDSHLDAMPRRSWGSTATLRHRPLDPRTERDYYCACYRDAWLAAHGDLRGFYPEPYWKAAREHLRLDPESVLVLLDGDKPVGLVDLDPLRASEEGCGWLSLLYLIPEYRGKGYGIQALGRAVVGFRTQGRRALRLLAAEDNAAACAFYRREGFSCVGEEEGSHGRLLLLERPLTERRDDL
jgi:probable phosphoglycerate mutase